MFAKKGVVIVGGMAMAAMALAHPAGAQLSGRVVLADGPIGVSIVFGERPAPVLVSPVAVRRAAPRPVRFGTGMSMRELERYLARIEHEYKYYRRMHPRDAYYYHGWTARELDAYVRWLRDERRYLKDERKRLERGARAWEREEREWDREWARERRDR